MESFTHRKVLSVGTNRSEQTVQPQNRLLLMEQSDQRLHCLPFHPTFLDVFWQCKTIPLHFYNNYSYHDSVPIFRILRYFVEEYIKAFSEFWHLLSYEPLQLCLIYATMKSKLNVISLKPAMLNVRHYRLKAYFAVKQALNQSRTNRLEVNALF